MNKPTAFNSVSEAISAASYVEQMLNAEYQWINARLSWLFVSQSFCITAFTILMTSTGSRYAGGGGITLLRLGLPVFGVVCCVLVAGAIFAANRVVESLARERSRLVRYINENSPACIPLSGTEGELKKHSWISLLGGLPHKVLPWVLGGFWFVLLIWFG